MILFVFLIFLVGIISDLKIISSPNKRIIIQIFIVLLAVKFLNLKIDSTRIILIDELINNKIFNYFFVSFCVLILINGTNFVDGLNGLSLGYYIAVAISIIFLSLENNYFFQIEKISYFVITLILLFIYNLFNRIYIGDSGAYTLAFIFSVNLIDIYSIYPNISPFFIIVLLWYPCFELLFSIIRKYNFNRSPIQPDVNHLHQLVYFFIKNKIKSNELFCNNLSSLFIIIYNVIIFYLSLKNIYNTQFQVILILVSTLIYTFLYIKLLKYKILRKK